MNLHLAEIAKAVAPSAHAVLLVDQAGWHLSTRLVVPANITIISASGQMPRAQPVPTSGSSSATIGSPTASSKSFDDLIDHCCAAWNTLVDQPWRIMSIGLRRWAHGY